MLTDGTPNAVDATQDALKAPDASGATGERPSDAPETITRAEHNRILADSQSKKDKTIAQLTKERDTFKAKTEEYSARADRATAEREEAEKALDDAVRDNPDQEEILKLKRELRSTIAAEKAALKKERDAFAQEKEAHGSEWETHAAEIEESKQNKWDKVVSDTAQAVGGDAAKLKATALEFGVTEPDKLKKLANTLWPVPVVKADSGRTLGGGLNLDGASPREKIKAGLAMQKKK
jgi:hypothetical protein